MKWYRLKINSIGWDQPQQQPCSYKQPITKPGRKTKNTEKKQHVHDHLPVEIRRRSPQDYLVLQRRGESNYRWLGGDRRRLELGDEIGDG
jgi:hypothetical protein